MKKLLFTTIMSAICAAPAFAQNSPTGYLTNNSNEVVKSGFELCWQTSSTNSPMEECGDKVEPPKVIPEQIKPKDIPVIPAKVIPKVEVKHEKIVINASALFQFDSYNLSETGKKILEEKVVFLKPTAVEIYGHTDLIGNEKYNMKLSQQRAEAAKDFLVLNGVEPEKIKTVAMGESQPVCKDKKTTKNSDCSVKNRRIEIEAVSIK